MSVDSTFGKGTTFSFTMKIEDYDDEPELRSFTNESNSSSESSESDDGLLN